MSEGAGNVCVWVSMSLIRQRVGLEWCKFSPLDAVEKCLRYSAAKRLKERGRDCAHLAGRDFRKIRLDDFNIVGDQARAVVFFPPP